VVAECFKIAVTEAKKGNVTSETFKGRLEENFNFQLFLHVEKDYLSSSQFLTFCSNFCTQELEVKNTPIEAKNELYKLTHIWDSISFIPDSELLTLLVKDNSILSQLCQVVLKPQIGQKEINLLKSTKDFSLLMLLKIYCTLNQLNYTEERYSGNEGIQIYLDLAKQPLLTQEEEKKYGLLAMQGDLEAKKILCERNLLLVAKVAYQYLGRGLPLDDLIQEGNLGLIRAIEKFDVRKGNRLSTYATYWIRQAIKRAIYDKVRDIRLPVHIEEKLSQYTKIKNALTITLNRVPTVEEIASQMNISVEQLNKLLQNGQTIESLNQKIADQEQEKQDLFVDDSPSLENQVILSDFQVKFIEQMKECINEREFEVLEGVIEGNLFVTGDYKSHEVSANVIPFSFKIPFSIEIPEETEKETITLEISDFAYDILDDSKIKVNIELELSGEMKTEEKIEEETEIKEVEVDTEEILRMMEEIDPEEENDTMREESEIEIEEEKESAPKEKVSLKEIDDRLMTIDDFLN